VGSRGAYQAQGLAKQPVLDLVDGLDALEAGILEDKQALKGAMQGNVNVLIDRGRDQKPGMLGIIRRQVGSAPAQGNPKGRSRDNHLAKPRRFAKAAVPAAVTKKMRSPRDKVSMFLTRQEAMGRI
jgi:hypothetical protein